MKPQNSKQKILNQKLVPYPVSLDYLVSNSKLQKTCLSSKKNRSVYVGLVPVTLMCCMLEVRLSWSGVSRASPCSTQELHTSDLLTEKLSTLVRR